MPTYDNDEDQGEGAALARLYEVLALVEPMHKHLGALRGVDPPTGSPWREDAVEPLARYVRQGSAANIGAGMDNLFAWARLLRKGELLSAWAHFTLLRAAMEGTSLARWLVDPTVGSRVRIARGVGSMLADLGERAKIERMPRPPDAPPIVWGTGKPADVRIRELEEEAAVAGLCPLRIGYIEAVSRYGPGEGAYRILSAFAHGGQAIPLTASRLQVDEEQDQDGGHNVRMEANTTYALSMTEQAIWTAYEALADFYAYYGQVLPLKISRRSVNVP